MSMATKATSAAAAALLGAGLLFVGGSPAQAAPAASVTGKALLTWGGKCPAMAKSLKPAAPATSQGGRLSLPVTSATGKEIKLGGAMQVSVNGQVTGLLQSPMISIGGTRTGKFIVSGPGGTPGSTVTIGLFNIANFTKATVDPRTRQWSGVLQAPVKDTATATAVQVAQLLSGLCGTPIAPGDSVGSVNLTVTTS